jgi:hypothetical protein
MAFFQVRTQQDQAVLLSILFYLLRTERREFFFMLLTLLSIGTSEKGIV